MYETLLCNVKAGVSRSNVILGFKTKSCDGQEPPRQRRLCCKYAPFAHSQIAEAVCFPELTASARGREGGREGYPPTAVGLVQPLAAPEVRRERCPPATRTRAAEGRAARRDAPPRSRLRSIVRCSNGLCNLVFLAVCFGT